MENKLRKPKRKSELEELRNSVKSPENNWKEITKTLSKDLVYGHASFLFVETTGRQITRNICKPLTSTDSIIDKGWQDFAAVLGLTYTDIQCIAKGNYWVFHRCPDVTEITLLKFSLRKDATVDKILKALLTINRVDVISEIIQDLKELAIQIKEKSMQIEEIVSNKCSTLDKFFKTSTGTIIHKGFLELINTELPITLLEPTTPNNDYIVKSLEKFYHEISKPDRKIQIESLQQSRIVEVSHLSSQNNQQHKYSKLVMLTFAADGETIANKVAEIFRKTYNITNNLPIGVLILEDHKNTVLNNAENFIIHLFSQMDFIVPILTEGYFNALSSRNSATSDCIDERYIKNIHDLMVKSYSQNNCLNKKVRCIIPSQDALTIHENPDFLKDPVLWGAWVNEYKTEDLARSMVDTKKSWEKKRTNYPVKKPIACQ